MRIKLSICITAVMLCCSMAYGLTVTFDEMPSGTILQGSGFAHSNRLWFMGDFWATDHAGSTWGPPHSGSNVLTMMGVSSVPSIMFGYVGTSSLDLDATQSVSAYFSTDTGKVVTMKAYNYSLFSPLELVTTVVIGAPGESWNNRFVEISAPLGSSFNWLKFEAAGSIGDLSGFCLDDITITPVPEPSSLIALTAGLAGMGTAIRRKRR